MNMRVVVGFAVSLLTAAAVVGQDAGAPPNLLKNPGFEETADAGGKATAKDWSFNKYCGDLEIAVDTQTAHTGRNSVRITANVPRDAMGAAAQQTVTGIKPGSKYKVSGWVKTEGLKRKNGEGSAGIQLNFVNDKKQRLKLEDVTASKVAEWKEISVTGVAPEHTTGITVTCIWGGGNVEGTMWYDDVSLVEVK